MKRLIAVSALAVGFLTTLAAPVGLGLQQAATAGTSLPRETFYFPTTPLPEASPGTPLLDKGVGQPQPGTRATIGRAHTGFKTLVSWPGSCGRADRASVVFVNNSQQPTKTVGATGGRLSTTVPVTSDVK